MRTKHFFYLLAALPLIFVACDKRVGDDANAQKPENYDVRIEAKYLLAEYWGDEFSPGVDNYSIIIAENEFKMDFGGTSLAAGSYYCLDVYAPVTDDGKLPAGTYTLDMSESCSEWTIDGTVSCLIVVDENGNFVTDEEGVVFSEATLVVEENHAELTAVVEGKTHYVTFSGKFASLDSTNDGGDVIRLTTLLNDVEVEGDAAMFVVETLGEVTDDGRELAYMLVVEDYEEFGNGSCAMFMLEVALEEGSDTISGTYSVAEGTLNVGAYDADGMYGSWYFETVDGDMGIEYAAIQDGSVTFTQDGDGCAMTLDCSDAEGYAIKATLSGMFLSESFAPGAFMQAFNR